MVRLRNLGKDSGNGGELKREAFMGAQGRWKRQGLALEETLGGILCVCVCTCVYLHMGLTCINDDTCHSTSVEVRKQSGVSALAFDLVWRQGLFCVVLLLPVFGSLAY